MTFSVTGRYLGKPVRVTWTNGVLSGDVLTCDAVALRLRDRKRAVYLPGLIDAGPSLDSPLAALATIADVLDGRDYTYEGDMMPSQPALPEGAIV